MFQQTIWGRAWVQWMRIVLTVCLLATFASVQAQSNAANYPQKPVKILVGFSPGGVPDIVARVLAPKFTEDWKQPVVVENKLGAGSNIAAQAAATSPPDGYTLLSISSAHAISPAIYSKLPYDATKDFSGITLTATGPALVIVSPELNVNNMKEFVALAKSKPGQLNYASAGVGSGAQFAAELLKVAGRHRLGAHSIQRYSRSAHRHHGGQNASVHFALCQCHQFGERRQGQSHRHYQHHANARPTEFAHRGRVGRARLQMDFLVRACRTRQHTP